MAEQSQTGRIVRVSGPIVEADGLAHAEAYEVVEVGEDRLIGEVIRIEHDRATIQVYEYTGQVRPGQEVRRTGMPLSVHLAPGLIGRIYDGIQRPLPALYDVEGAFMARGVKAPAVDLERTWPYKPLVEEGNELSGGQAFGTVQETQSIEHRLLVPPGTSGRVVHIEGEGEHKVSDVVCVIENGSGRHELTLGHRWPARVARPFAERERSVEPLVTGLRIIDTFFPIARGGAAAVPGGFGTGKTMTQHALAKWCNADIIVYIGCGERGNEMTDVLTEFPEIVDPRTGRSLMERTVLIANTSNMPVAAREVSIYTGITIAEYYRDMGYHVAIMADSTSRWAEALRELSSRLEEMPAEEGFPAYLPTRLAQFYERSGWVTTLSDHDASVTIIGAVSPPGGDFSEPVTQHTRRFIRCFWALDSTLANARHYPAIQWLESYSEYLDDVTDWWNGFNPDWRSMREEAMRVLQQESRLQQIVKLVGPDVLPDSQRLVLLVADILKNGFLQQNAFDEIDRYSTPEKQIALLRAILTFYRRAREVIDKGAPLTRVHELKISQDLMRVKSRIANDDADAQAALLERVDQEFSELEKEYA
jgi:V/A-type H+-transporting ATPase subunit A